MKKRWLSFLLCSVSCSYCLAQSGSISPFSIGFKAGLNSSTVALKDFPDGVSTKRSLQLVSGFFASFPVTERFAVQPELLYSVMGAKINRPALSTSNAEQKLAYLSLPLQASIRASKSLSLLIGPQFDFLTAANVTVDNQTQSNKEEIQKFDIALTGGLQYSPLPKFIVSARYIHGLKNVPRDQVEGSYFNRGIQLTVGIRLGNKEPMVQKPVVRTVALVPDEDKDGVGDLDDKCPLVAGSAKYNGCPVPDTDNDGINDEEDQCPEVVGVARYKGCPVPDNDKDGINNEEDKCPDVAGVAAYAGCPVPDKDADGVPDATDNCPDLAGTEANHGCPVIETSTFNSGAIQFLSGSITLTPSAAAALDEGAALLMSKSYSLLKIHISGFTDNTGKQSSNKYISQKRADAVKEYLVRKGVDPARITSTGYGSESPVADNSTEAGRSKNRRVEFTIHQ